MPWQRATYEWATEGRNKLGERYGDKYRIAYCMHEGDFPVPEWLDRRDDGLQRAPRRQPRRRKRLTR